MSAHRPKRYGKGDRLLTPDASASEIAVDHAVAPFDAAATNADRVWGVDKLPALVSPQTAAKYGSALAKLNAAIAASDPDETAARAGVCVRGLAALDAEARALGHQPTPPNVWRVNVDGAECVIIDDAQKWPLIESTMPGVRIYTLREVENALAAYGRIASTVKDAFPGAQITAVGKSEFSSPIGELLDDEIPF